jgi:hypothetical protein
VNVGLHTLAAIAPIGRLTTKEITPAVLSKLAKSLGFVADSEMIEKLSEVIRGGSEESFAAWLSTPEKLAKLRTFLRPDEESEPVVLVCPHCSQAFEVPDVNTSPGIQPE